MDLIAGDTKGQVWLFLNEGSGKEPRLAEGVRVEAAGKPIVGTQKTYREVGGSYVVDKVTPGNHPLADTYSWLHMADWNGDGLQDLLIGHSSSILFYRNVGASSAPEFTDPVSIEGPGDGFPSRSSPYVVDWDGDWTVDLLVGGNRGGILFYRNEGTNEEPVLAEARPLRLVGDGFDDGYRNRLEVTDWNGDGILDLLVGNFVSSQEGESTGNIWLFLGE